MGEPLENVYFNWLYAKVCDPRARTPSRRFETLLGQLHRIEYVWLITGDDNRAEDGLDLRAQFARELRLDDVQFMDNVCSVLEMLVALAFRIAFDTDETIEFWFERFMQNLQLEQMHDGSDYDSKVVEDIIFTFVWREYDFNGGGGLFPLLRCRHDQRGVEVWYQFSAYSEENDFG